MRLRERFSKRQRELWGRNLIIPLEWERWFWRQYNKVRYPRIYWYDRKKWHSRPKIGDRVEDCRYRIQTVVAFGKSSDDGPDEDTLIFEDGSSASWMHCCDWPEEVNHAND